MRIFYIFFVFLTLIFKDPLSLDFEQLETKSGIKFWLVEDNSLPLVSLSFSFKGGALADGLGKEGTTNLMTSLLDEGTDGFTAENFKLSMRENGVKISFSSRKRKLKGTFTSRKISVAGRFLVVTRLLIIQFLRQMKLTK